MLSADRKVRPGRLEKTVLLGELARDGRVRPGHICDLVVHAVASTIADLAGHERPRVEDVTTAMGFRQTGAER